MRMQTKLLVACAVASVTACSSAPAPLLDASMDAAVDANPTDAGFDATADTAVDGIGNLDAHMDAHMDADAATDLDATSDATFDAAFDGSGGPVTTVFVSDDFNTLRPGIWGTTECPQSYSCTTPEESAGSANHVLRVEWHPWDKRNALDEGHSRGGAELHEEFVDGTRTLFNPATGAQGWDVRTPGGPVAEGSLWPTLGNDLWYRWRFRVNDAAALDVGNATSFVMGQWHHQGSLGAGFSPVVSMTFNDVDSATDRVALVLQVPELPYYFPAGHTSCTYAWEGGTHCQFSPFKVALPKTDRGTWHEVMFHIRWASHDITSADPTVPPSTGFLEFFFDGAPQTVASDVTGTQIPPVYAGATRLDGLVLLHNTHVNYFAMGLYVLSWPEPLPDPTPAGNIVIDYDDYRAWHMSP